MMIKDCNSCNKDSRSCEVFHSTIEDCPEWETREGTHNLCHGCFYIDTDSDDIYPCCDCKGTAKTTEETRQRFDLYTKIPVHKHDAVNHPFHYTTGGIECIDAMESAFGAENLMKYCKIAAFKYVWRMDRKGGTEDIKKAIWYLEKYLELEERNKTNDQN